MRPAAVVGEREIEIHLTRDVAVLIQIELPVQIELRADIRGHERAIVMIDDVILELPADMIPIDPREIARDPDAA
jgi:hypothetical protein